MIIGTEKPKVFCSRKQRKNKYPDGKPEKKETLQTETSYVVRGKKINRDIESSGERNQMLVELKKSQ